MRYLSVSVLRVPLIVALYGENVKPHIVKCAHCVATSEGNMPPPPKHVAKARILSTDSAQPRYRDEIALQDQNEGGIHEFNIASDPEDEFDELRQMQMKAITWRQTFSTKLHPPTLAPTTLRR